MTPSFSFRLLTICGTLAGLLPVGSRAGVPVDTNQDSRQAPPPVVTVAAQNPAANAAPLSPGLEDIVKLAKAGLNESVILSFIKCSEVAYQPSAEEVVRLHESGVSATIIAALLRRVEELRPRAVEAEAQQQQPAQPSAQSAQASRTFREETPMKIYYTRPPVQVIYLPSSSYYGGSYYGNGGSYYGSGYYSRSYYGSCYSPSYYGSRGYYGGYRGSCYGGYRGYYGGYRGGYRYCR